MYLIALKFVAKATCLNNLIFSPNYAEGILGLRIIRYGFLGHSSMLRQSVPHPLKAILKLINTMRTTVTDM